MEITKLVTIVIPQTRRQFVMRSEYPPSTPFGNGNFSLTVGASLVPKPVKAEIKNAPPLQNVPR
jgi:hypothetical protein